MPHITLEYTDNVSPALDFAELFARVHGTIAELGSIRIGNCKSRAVPRSVYYVGDGTSAQAFVHADVRFLEGRAAAAREGISRSVLRILREAFPESVAGGTVQITVEVSEIARQAYAKHPADSLEYR